MMLPWLVDKSLLHVGHLSLGSVEFLAAGVVLQGITEAWPSNLLPVTKCQLYTCFSFYFSLFWRILVIYQTYFSNDKKLRIYEM
jgi:hypothetical protein